MQLKQRPAYIALSCVSLLMGVVLLISVQAQAPTRAQIAFTANRDGSWDIYAMDADGKNQRNLTNNPARDRMPKWSPDGRRIASVSNRDLNAEVSVIFLSARNRGVVFEDIQIRPLLGILVR